MKKDEFYQFLRRIPKTEIHLHVEATLTRRTVQTLIKRHPNESSKQIDVDKLFSYNNLKDFINSFLYVQSLITSTDDLTLMFEDTAEYLRENNLVYAEVFFSPSMFLRKGLVFSEMMATIQKAIDIIEKRDRITIKVIIDVSRTFGVDNAQANLDATLHLKTPAILGIGLGGDEEKGPANLFGEVFQQARARGLHVVAHAGEVVGPQSIWDALTNLGAERIGHGLSAIQDPKLVRHLAERQIPIEICVTSNVITQKYVTKAKDHPVRAYFDQRLLVTINTDDPTFFNCSIIDELWTLHSKLDFSMAEIKTLVINGFKASFLCDEDKVLWTSRVEEAWNLASDRK